MTNWKGKGMKRSIKRLRYLFFQKFQKILRYMFQKTHCKRGHKLSQCFVEMIFIASIISPGVTLGYAQTPLSPNNSGWDRLATYNSLNGSIQGHLLGGNGPSTIGTLFDFDLVLKEGSLTERLMGKLFM
jgi:hypothetical protein